MWQKYIPNIQCSVVQSSNTLTLIWMLLFIPNVCIIFSRMTYHRTHCLHLTHNTSDSSIEPNSFSSFSRLLARFSISNVWLYNKCTRNRNRKLAEVKRSNCIRYRKREALPECVFDIAQQNCSDVILNAINCLELGSMFLSLAFIIQLDFLSRQGGCRYVFRGSCTVLTIGDHLIWFVLLYCHLPQNICRCNSINSIWPIRLPFSNTLYVRIDEKVKTDGSFVVTTVSLSYEQQRGACSGKKIFKFNKNFLIFFR